MNNTAERPMNLWEINNKIESLQIDASILYETINAVCTAVAEETIDVSDLHWAMIGITRSAYNLKEDLGGLTEESFEIFKNILGSLN